MTQLARLIFSSAALLGSARIAAAEIKDYEVLRLLYLHTPCGLASVTSRETSAAFVRFNADCQNRTAFPDGAVVVCSDHHDDRSCKVETAQRRFESLDLLKQKP